MDQFLDVKNLPAGEIGNTLGLVAGYSAARPFFYKQHAKKHAEEMRALDTKKAFDQVEDKKHLH